MYRIRSWITLTLGSALSLSLSMFQHFCVNSPPTLYPLYALEWIMHCAKY